MISWILKILDNLQRCNERFNSLLSTVMLIGVLKDTKLLHDNFLQVKHYQVLCKGLCIPSNFKSSSWNDFISYFSDYREQIVDVLKDLHNQTLNCKQSLPEVIFSFPLLHFAEGLCVPFQNVSNLPVLMKTSKSNVSYFDEVIAKR